MSQQQASHASSGGIPGWADEHPVLSAVAGVAVAFVFIGIVMIAVIGIFAD
jgi:hypothetical protein